MKVMETININTNTNTNNSIEHINPKFNYNGTPIKYPFYDTVARR